MEKEIYQKRQFYTYEKTNYSCPQCHVGRLRIDRKSIKAIEYKNYNKKIQSTDEFEVEWLKIGFYGHLVCDNKECKEKIVFAGKLTSEYGEYENPFVGEDDTIIHNEQKITIEYIERSPQIIELKRAYPKEINKILSESFKLFWIDTNSCANKIRICLEILMNTLKVKKHRNKNGKRLFLSLHERINIFAQRDDTLKDILISIKWIGNYGSHQDEIVSPDDILDGYFLIEYALNKIYVNTEKEIKKIVNEINRSRKPRSKKK